MNKTAELVSVWATYELSHPKAEIADFCRYYITSTKQMPTKGFLDGIVPPDLQSTMAKLTGRIYKLHLGYAVSALKKIGLNTFDEFTFLNSVYKMNEPMKTEVIYQNFNELSSGLLIIDRLKKSGYLTEQDNKNDKRSKRLKLTKKGTDTLLSCYNTMQHVNELFFNEMQEDDLQLCIHLLTPLEIKFSGLWKLHKGKEFTENYREITGKNVLSKRKKNSIKK